MHPAVQQLLWQHAIAQASRLLLEKHINQHQGSHAYVFSGRQGTGVLDVAELFIQRILRLDDKRAIREQQNVFHIRREESQQEISIDQIRALQNHVRLKSLNADPVIALITDAESLSRGAQHALLKTFEEPPGGVIVLFVVDNEQSLLSTLRSRAWMIRVGAVPKTALLQALHKVFPQEDQDVLEVCARLSLCRVREALTLIEQPAMRSSLIENASAFLGALWMPLWKRIRWVHQALPASETVQETRTKALLLLNTWESVLRDVLLVHIAVDDSLRLATLRDQYRTVPRNQCSRVLKTLCALSEARAAIAQFIQPHLALETIIMSHP